MSAIASNDEQWYFVPPQICFSEYAMRYGQKKMSQKVLARSTQHFQTSSVELSSFLLPCFGISGTSVLENAGPDSTFLFTVTFDIPPPEGLMLKGEFHSNFQDQVHLRHSVSGAIMASLIVKAIWDLTPQHSAMFYPLMLSSPTASSCQTDSIDQSAMRLPVVSGCSKHLPATTAHSTAAGPNRPKYDEAEDSFYRSLLAGKAAGEAASADTSSSASMSAPKDSRIKLSAEDAAFYSQVIAGVKASPCVEEGKMHKPVKPVVHLDGDDSIIIDGIKYDSWGNIISEITDNQQQNIQDAVKVRPANDFLAAKKKLPQLGPTILRGSNVPALTAAAVIAGTEHDGNRYLHILEGTLIPDIQGSDQLLCESISKRPGKKIGARSQVSSLSSHGAKVGTKAVASTSLASNHQKLQAFSVDAQKTKKSTPVCTTLSPLKTEDELNDAWDAL
jgi:hypothetical protein